MATTTQVKNNSKPSSSQTQLPEARCTAHAFYGEYLDQEANVQVGPFTYTDDKNLDALPFDFPTRDFLDTLRVDAHNTVRYQIHVSEIIENKRRAHHLPKHAEAMNHHLEPDVRRQFAAKMAAMKSLSGMAAQAIRELEERVVLWMEVERKLGSNIEALKRLMKGIDQLSEGGKNAK